MGQEIAAVVGDQTTMLMRVRRQKRRENGRDLVLFVEDGNETQQIAERHLIWYYVYIQLPRWKG
jgi:hypothetical protein